MLEEFYRNEAMREDVHTFLLKYLEQRAVEKVFDRQDTSAIAEAREMIDGAFVLLGEAFAPNVKKKEHVDHSM